MTDSTIELPHDPRMVLPQGSTLLEQFKTWAATAKIVFFAGLPGVGKSLYLQQLALLAQRNQRRVHLLLWDRSRLAIERPPYSDADRYPEDRGSTHPAIRKAVGMWARGAVAAWATEHANDDDILIGEVPLAGSRLIELVQMGSDSAEPILTAPTTIFCTPVPSQTVRQHIETARHKTIAAPRDEREKYDAPPNVMYSTWYDMHAAAVALGITENDTAEPAYDAAVYAATYGQLLRYRNAVTLAVDVLLKPSGSVYDLDNVAGELAASEADVERVMGVIDGMDSAEIAEQVANWYRF